MSAEMRLETDGAAKSPSCMMNCDLRQRIHIAKSIGKAGAVPRGGEDFDSK